MLPAKASSGVFIVGVILVIVLALIPWGVTMMFAPLRPEVLEDTPAAYYPTESAFQTREAELELSATSSFEIWTPESQDMPQAITVTPTGLDVVEVPDNLTGTATYDLKVYRCPTPSKETTDRWPAGEPFEVLGWNLDLDDNMYFLIEDDPATLQKWVRRDEGVELSFSDVKVLFPTASGCRTWTTDVAVPPTAPPTIAAADITSTATIALPQIVTATPLPPQEIQIILTDEEASEQAAETIPDLENPQVHFSPDDVYISGTVRASTVIGTVTGKLNIHGTLEIRDGKLHFTRTSVNARGTDYTDRDEGRQAENVVNDWLTTLMVRRTALDFELGDGILTIDAMEYYESIFPTSMPTTSPTSVGGPEATDVQATTSTAVAPEMDDLASSDVVLPQAMTVTPTPSSPVEITTQSANADAAENLPVFVEPAVDLTATGMNVSGMVEPPVSIPGVDLSGTVAVTGDFFIKNGLLQLDVQSVTLNGVPLNNPTLLTILTDAINGWLPTLHNRQPISDFELDDDGLRLLP